MSVKVLPDGTQVADFQYDFALEGKSIETHVQDDGSLLIEGYASDFDVDRQGDVFEPGAFERGLKAFMDSNPILLYHHKTDTALGKVKAAHVDDKGLYIKARVDAPEPGTMIADYWRKIKNGTLRAFSVGGIFRRHNTDTGPRIFDVDLAEVSVTPLPVNPRTLFNVAGKAFETAPAQEPVEDSDDEAEFKSVMEALAVGDETLTAISSRLE